MRYERRVDEVKIPPSAGVAGFLEALKGILALRGVQSVHINSRGTVSYERMVPEDAPETTLGIDLSTLTLDAAIRTCVLSELSFNLEENAAETVCRCFVAARVDGVVPICFGVGSGTLLWKWFRTRSKVAADLPKDEFFGLPVIAEPKLPNEALVMLAGFERTAALVDATHAYKIPLVME